MKNLAHCYIGLGSNLANPEKNVTDAIDGLSSVGNVAKVSRLYRTKPWGVTDQPSFINAVIELTTALEPFELLKQTQKLELAMGREKTYRWGPRLIDIDILTYDDISINEASLVIPHPHMLQRVFVLLPLTELDPAYSRHLDALTIGADDIVALE